MSNDAATAAAIYTIDKWLKGVDDNVSTEKPEFFWFRDVKKTFAYNQHGPGVRWLPRLERGTVEGFARETRLTVNRKNRAQQALLNNRGYGMGEMIHTTDIWENGTPERIAELVADMLDAMTGDIINAVNSGFYNDGTDTTYDALGFQGCNSFLITTGSYAGLSVTTYPKWASRSILSSTAPYNAFSSDPLVALDAMITYVRQGGGGEHGRTSQTPDVGFMSWDKFNVLKATLMRRYNFQLPQNKTIQAFGDLDHAMYGGVTWWPSFEVPTDSGNSQAYLLRSSTIKWEFPGPKFLNEFREEQGIPRSIYALYIVYGRIRCTAPRNNGRFWIN